MIEDALRETFAAQVDGAPRLDGLADSAIRRARQVRRRRAVTSGLAGFAVLAVAGVMGLRVLAPGIVEPSRPGVTAGRHLDARPEGAVPQADTLPSTSARQIEVVQDGEIFTSNRIRVQLPSKDATTSAYRTHDGYLVVTSKPQGKQLLLLDEAGNNRVLLDDAKNIAVSARGDKIAWADDDTMSVADRTGGRAELGKPATVKAPDQGAPVAFVGDNVILARSENAPDGPAFGLWYPARPAYVERWDSSVVRLFGARPDGKAFYAQVADDSGDKQLCLALLVPDQPFRVQDKACGLPTAVKQGGGVSPDGRWLAYPVAGQKQVAMLDLTEIFKANGKARVWDAPTANARTVWLDATTFVVDDGTNFVSLNPTQQGRSYTVQGGSAGKVLIEPLAN